MRNNEPATLYMNQIPRAYGVFRIRMSRTVRFRLWLAKQLIRLGAWVANADVRFEDMN